MTPEEKLLPLLRGVIPDGDGKWKACCPIHNGGNEEHPSLHIERGADGRLLMHCFVCGPEIKAAQFCARLGITQAELYPEDAIRRNGQKPGAAWRGKIVAKYDYLDADGALVYQVCRLDPKDFRQRRPNGQGGWIKNLRGVTRVLYQLPSLLSAPINAPIFIAEGEKDVDKLRSLGLIATTNVGGAGKWSKSYSEVLKGRMVFILPDNDAPGQEHAAKIVLSLHEHAKSIKAVNLPGLPPKGDISDWLAAGGTAAKLLELAGAAPPATSAANQPGPQPTQASAVDDPAAVHFETELLRDLQLDVLGEIDDSGGAVKVFSEAHRKSDIIKDVAKLSFERLVQICGPVIKAKVTRGTEDVAGMYSVADVRRAIGLLSGYRRITDETESGVGCWQGINDDGLPADSVILVGAGSAAKWNGNRQLELITKPRAGARLLDIGSSDPWYDAAELGRLLQDCDQAAAEAAVRDAIKLLERWSWKHSESPLVVTGIILATWIQTVWAWRPQVAIVGSSNTGKSTLFEALEGIFGRLCVKSSKSSAAGIRQAIRHSAKIMLCDEFESGRVRDEVLEMLRASGRGDRVIKGTSGHKAREFTLRHIVWVAAIESGLRREPDRNRFVTLELVPPADSQMGKLTCPSPAELGRLGQRLLAVAVRYGLPARGLAVELKSRRYEGVHARVIESYSVPAAIVAGLLGLTGDAAAGVLERMLTTVDRSETVQSDDDTLLQDILASNIDMGRGERVTVGQAIAARKTIDPDSALNQVGLCLFDDEEINGMHGDWLYVAHNIVIRKLLKDTNWLCQSIDQILSRIPGAQKTRRRFGGLNSRGVAIPMHQIEAVPAGTAQEQQRNRFNLF